MAKALVWKLILAVGIPLFAVHFIASFNSWYWTLPWLDMVMHFWGGVLAAISFYLIFPKIVFGGGFKENFLPNLVLVLGWTALVGVGWEWFEYYYDIFFNSGKMIYWAGILSDTLSDLFLDILGALSLVVLLKVIYNLGEKDVLKK